jgi:YesN/AraC family two-component response regulator
MRSKLRELLNSLFGRKDIKEKGRNREFNEADYIQHRLDLFMAEKKPYLQHRYTITQLSEAIKIPAYQISAIINLRTGGNFSDYLNKLRIHYCQELIKIAGGKKINIQELGGECGFHNRNTFTNAFKKFTGLTPSEYIKQHW